MKKIICSIALSMFVFLVGLTNQVSAQQTSIKLFDATPPFGTGPTTSAAVAIPFAITSVILHFTPGDTAVISSTPDGTGPIVIDNFLTINGKNACEGVAGQVFPDSCFGPAIAPTVPTGDPIDTILTPIPPIDVSAFVPLGTTAVVFELRDFGIIAGNTDLFLVTTASVIGPTPPTVGHAFDKVVELLAGQLRPAAVEAFEAAFEAQVIIPVLRDLQKANASPETIANVEKQLVEVKAQTASIAATAVVSLLDGQSLVSQLQRKRDTFFQEPQAVPCCVTRSQVIINQPPQ